MSRRKIVAVVAAALGSLFLVEVLSGGFQAVSGEYYRDRAAGRPSAEDVFSDLRSQGYLMYDTIKEELPEEYAALQRDMEAIASRSPSAADARDETLQTVEAIRRKHARSIYQAPDDRIFTVVRSQLDLLDLVDSRETGATCARFVVGGGAVLGRPDEHYLKAFDADSTAVFRAIGAARKNPQPIEAPTDADWQEVFRIMDAMGGMLNSMDDLRRLSVLDPKDEKLCKTMRRYFRALLAAEGPSGRRVRAEIAYGLAAG